MLNLLSVNLLIINSNIYYRELFILTSEINNNGIDKNDLYICTYIYFEFFN